MNRTKILILASFLAGAGAGSVLLPRHVGGPVHATTLEPGPLRTESSSAVPQEQGRMTEDHASASEATGRVTPVVRAVRVAGPSVVNIQIGRLLQGRDGRPVFRKAGEGSGVIVEEDGLVISNWHVVKDSVRADFYCRISLRDGRTFPGRVLSSSRENDLALLLIQTKEEDRPHFEPIQMGDSDELMVGETVVAIGNPQGQANSVTSGVLSAMDRSLLVTPRGEREPIRFEGLLQTDAAINPGNSGGALLDITGRLIGINTLVQQRSENIGFAIPVNRVKQVFQSNLLRYDRIDRFWTGLRVDEDGGKVLVQSVTRDGPAWRAGLRPGDRILSIGNKGVASLQDFGRALIRFEAGQVIPMQLTRDDQPREAKLQPWSPTASRIFVRSGLVVDALRYGKDTELMRSAHEALYGRDHMWNGPISALRVVDVQKDGPGAQLGLRQGDVIVGFKQKEPWTGYDRRVALSGGAPQLAEILDHFRGQSLHVLIYRPGKPLQSGPLDVR